MLVVQRNFLGESHPAAGERPEGVFGGRGERGPVGVRRSA